MHCPFGGTVIVFRIQIAGRVGDDRQGCARECKEESSHIPPKFRNQRQRLAVQLNRRILRKSGTHRRLVVGKDANGVERMMCSGIRSRTCTRSFHSSAVKSSPCDLASSTRMPMITADARVTAKRMAKHHNTTTAVWKHNSAIAIVHVCGLSKPGSKYSNSQNITSSSTAAIRAAVTKYVFHRFSDRRSSSVIFSGPNCVGWINLSRVPPGFMASVNPASEHQMASEIPATPRSARASPKSARGTLPQVWLPFTSIMHLCFFPVLPSHHGDVCILYWFGWSRYSNWESLSHPFTFFNAADAHRIAGAALTTM